MHAENYFLTLTLSEPALQLLEMDGNRPHRSLEKADWQKFAKRLRKEIGPFRFLAVGEYGEEFLRPHYHAILFGAALGEGKVTWETQPTGRRNYRHEALAKCWPYGLHDLQDLATQSINYVCRYVQKKLRGSSQAAKDLKYDAYSRVSATTGETWEVQPEFMLVSRGRGAIKGIGDSWYQKFKGDLFPSDECIINGAERRVPDYYTKKLKEEDPNTHTKIKARRAKWAKAREQDNTPERREVREQITIAKMKRQKKKEKI
jgi:hypothetical protein